jgi:phosphotriesterase-related protein
MHYILKLLFVAVGLEVAGLALQGAGIVQTVSGPIAADDVGLTLSHEHVLVDFIGADHVSPDRYDRATVMAALTPQVMAAREAGVQVMVECTPAFLGRDPLLLKELSERTGMRFVTNTGLYGAVNDKFLPPYAEEETPRKLAARWIAEFVDGIEGSGIKPGFIKSAVDRDAVLSEMDTMLVHAAALTHLETGLTIAVHTGPGPGLAQLDILAEHGVHPSAWIWVHAQSARDEDLMEAARRGAWISLDGVRPRSIDRHITLCQKLRDAGYWDQVLISHDAGWYDPAKPGGGTIRGYTLIFEEFLPRLRAEGFSPEELDQLMAINPGRALSISVRAQSFD